MSDRAFAVGAHHRGLGLIGAVSHDPSTVKSKASVEDDSLFVIARGRVNVCGYDAAHLFQNLVLSSSDSFKMSAIVQK